MISNNYFYAVAFAEAMRKKLNANGIDTELSVSDNYRRVKAAFYCLEENEQARIKRMSERLAEEVLLMESKFFSDNRGICVESHLVRDLEESRDIIFRVIDTNREIGFKWSAGVNIQHVRLFRGVSQGSTACLIDISKEWFDIPASETYYIEMQPVVDRLYKMRNMNINDVYKDKITELYAPVLEAVKQEIIRNCEQYPETPENLIKHFFCKKDFYQIVPIGNSESTKVVAYNIHGTLGKCLTPEINRISYPTKLVEIRQKELPSKALSRTILHLVFDNGWNMEMRLHNTGMKIAGGVLMFDVRVTGIPHGVWQTQIF